MSGNFEGIKKQKFGVEIECTGLTREKAADAIAKALDSTAYYYGGAYGRYNIKDNKERNWKVVSDSSIDCRNEEGQFVNSKSYSVEVVTPILEYEDIGVLQDVVRSVRRSGGICNSSTGIHIHIDGAPYDAKKLRNLVNIFASKEDMLYRALQVNVSRELYCQKTDQRFLTELNRKKPKNMQTFKNIWYGDDYIHDQHYDDSRYHCLNLHSFFMNDNIEIRAFNATLHAGVIRAYICLALAISNQALTQKSASPRKTESTNQKYTFRTWLIRIGLNGEEFKNCRKHLLSHLEGNIAWLHQEDALAQRERLKQERIAAREQRDEDVARQGETVQNEETRSIEECSDDVTVTGDTQTEEESIRPPIMAI